MSRISQDMRCPSLTPGKRGALTANTYRVVLWEQGRCQIEAKVRVNDVSDVVDVFLVCSNSSVRSPSGLGRAMFRIDANRFAVESGTFSNKDGKPASLPRMGLILEVPDKCAWLTKFEERGE
jgi:hypothetical protein